MRPLPGSAVAWFGAGLGTTLALAGGALAAAGAWPDYVWTNWTFNALLTADIVRLPTTGSVVVLNLPFWILASGGAAVLLWRTRVDAGLASVAVVGSAMLGCLVVTRALRLHYLMLPLPMLAVVAAWALHELFERLALSPRQRCAVVMLIALPPVVGRAVSMKSTNQPQQAAIDFVLARSAPDEAMYDPALAFNVFRPDLHYFGDLPTDLRRVGEWYRRAAGARFAGYDPCARVHAGRPRFVSDTAGRFEACGLGLHYRPTAFEGLYQRVD
jgi:hypothetical protein